jgi:hypothetical protein
MHPIRILGSDSALKKYYKDPKGPQNLRLSRSDMQVIHPLSPVTGNRTRQEMAADSGAMKARQNGDVANPIRFIV